MKKILILILCVAAFYSSNAQGASPVSIGKQKDSTELKHVQIEATFPGGLTAWRNYLEKNLRADMGSRYTKVKSGQTKKLTVIVSFLVDKEGNISQVTAKNPDNAHKKIVQEAIRVIKKSPNWIPAEQDGKKVIYRQIQSIVFAIVAE